MTVIDFHTHIFPRGFRAEREAFFSGEPAFEELYCAAASRLVGKRDLIKNMDKTGDFRLSLEQRSTFSKTQ